MTIDWTDPHCKVSDFFTVHECLNLPTWNRMATEADGLTEEVKANLIKLCTAMDKVRVFFNHSINVHCCFRPAKYNSEVGGAPHSMHSLGSAMDFNVVSLECKDAIAMMLKDNKLEEWGMRCENNGPAPTWIHLDLKIVPEGGHRYFIP